MCVQCSTSNATTEVIQSRQTSAEAVEREREALLLSPQQRHWTAIPPSCLRHWGITDGPFGGKRQILQIMLWKQILHHYGLIVRFNTQHITAAGISGHRALYLHFASVISEYNQTPGLQNSRIEVPEHLCNLSTLCPLYQADLPSMILDAPHHIWNTTEYCLTATKQLVSSSEFSWSIK